MFICWFLSFFLLVSVHTLQCYDDNQLVNNCTGLCVAHVRCVSFWSLPVGCKHKSSDGCVRWKDGQSMECFCGWDKCNKDRKWILALWRLYCDRRRMKRAFDVSDSTLSTTISLSTTQATTAENTSFYTIQTTTAENTSFYTTQTTTAENTSFYTTQTTTAENTSFYTTQTTENSTNTTMSYNETNITTTEHYNPLPTAPTQAESVTDVKLLPEEGAKTFIVVIIVCIVLVGIAAIGGLAWWFVIIRRSKQRKAEELKRRLHRDERNNVKSTKTANIQPDETEEESIMESPPTASHHHTLAASPASSEYEGPVPVPERPVRPPVATKVGTKSKLHVDFASSHVVKTISGRSPVGRKKKKKAMPTEAIDLSKKRKSIKDEQVAKSMTEDTKSNSSRREKKKKEKSEVGEPETAKSHLSSAESLTITSKHQNGSTLSEATHPYGSLLEKTKKE